MGVIRTLTILLCFGVLILDASAQTRKKPKSSKPIAEEPRMDTLSSLRVRTSWDVVKHIAEPSYVGIIVETTDSYKRVLIEMEELRLPQPLISPHYLIEYPEIGIEQGIEGSVTFTVRVQEGSVVDAQIVRSDNSLLSDVVLQAAKNLQFDLSWHTDHGAEYAYTREVIFSLPDKVSLRSEIESVLIPARK